MILPSLNPSFNVQGFLKEHWGKTPVFLPNIISTEDLISPEELAGLACEEFVESRLVTNYGQRSFSHGPFSEEQFLRLPAKDWTLLVQSVDLFINEIKTVSYTHLTLPTKRIV